MYRGSSISWRNATRCEPEGSIQTAGMQLFIGWPGSHFNNLRFKNSQNINELSAAHVAVCVVSHEMMSEM